MQQIFGMVMHLYAIITTLIIVYMLYGKAARQLYMKYKNSKETQEKQKQTQLKRLVRQYVREYLKELQDDKA